MGEKSTTKMSKKLFYLKKECHKLMEEYNKLQGKNKDDKLIYNMIKIEMRITGDEAHISKFNNEQCKQLIKILEQKIINKKAFDIRQKQRLIKTGYNLELSDQIVRGIN